MYGQMGHTLKVFIIIKTPFYILKINKTANKKYICNTLLLKYLHLCRMFLSLTIIFFDILLVFFYFLQACYDNKLFNSYFIYGEKNFIKFHFYLLN